MHGEPRVVDTGHTVSVLHRVFEAQMPDGETEDVLVPECGTTGELYTEAKRLARRRWQERQQQQITGATTG